jgi:predicted nicotinamide N-methyase
MAAAHLVAILSAVAAIAMSSHHQLVVESDFFDGHRRCRLAVPFADVKEAIRHQCKFDDSSPDFSIEVFDKRLELFKPLVEGVSLPRVARIQLTALGNLAKKEMLALPFKMYDPAEGGIVIRDKRITIAESTSDPGLAHETRTGFSVWDGSIVLAKYLEHSCAVEDLSRSNVLEVGCGPGLAGLSAATLGARQVVLTDLKSVLENTRANVDQNAEVLGGAVVKLLPLDWTKPLPDEIIKTPPSLVLAADVVWVESLIDPLVQTFIRLAAAATAVNANTNKSSNAYQMPFKILLCYQLRSNHATDLLLTALRSEFVVTEIPHSDHHPQHQRPNVFIYSLVYKDLGKAGTPAPPAPPALPEPPAHVEECREDPGGECLGGAAGEQSK